MVQVYGSLGWSFHTAIERVRGGIFGPGLRQLRVELSYNNRKGLEAEYLFQVYGSLVWSFYTTIYRKESEAVFFGPRTYDSLKWSFHLKKNYEIVGGGVSIQFRLHVRVELSYNSRKGLMMYF